MPDVPANPPAGTLTILGGMVALAFIGPGTGTLTLTGSAIAVAFSGPSAGVLTLQGQAPTALRTGGLVAPPSGTLTLAGQTPIRVSGGSFSLAPGAGALTFTGQDFSVDFYGPDTGTLTLAGQTPSLASTTDTVRSPGTGTLSLTGQLPIPVSTGYILGTGTLTLTGSPVIVRFLGPEHAILTLTGHTASVVITLAGALTPGAGGLVLTGQTPTLVRPLVFAAPSGTLALTGRTPSVSAVGPLLDEARSGILHSGYGRSGEYARSLLIVVAGTDRSQHTQLEDLQITYTLDGTPDRLSARFRDFQPVRGQPIAVSEGGLAFVGTGDPMPGVLLFAGHILEVQQQSHKAKAKPIYQIEAVDYTWFMDRYARITRRYTNISVNTLVADILRTYTDGGFRTGYIPFSLGAIDDIQFTGETVSGAIERIAKAVGAFWSLDYRKHVHLFTTPNIGSPDHGHFEANTFNLTDGSTGWWDFVYGLDLTQVRTKVVYVGNGALTTAVVGGTSSTIPVDDCRWYSPTGGTIRAGETEATYTGKTVGSGPGELTGVSGLTQDIPQGESVYVVAVVEDTLAQANLAAILGASGVAVDYQADHRLSLDECTKRASADLDSYSGALTAVTFTTDDQYVKPGKICAVNLTEPTTINESCRIQQIELSVRTKVDGSVIGLQRTVTASAVRRQLIDVLTNRMVGLGRPS